MRTKKQILEMRKAVGNLFEDTDTISTEQWCKSRAIMRALNWMLEEMETDDLIDNLKKK